MNSSLLSGFTSTANGIAAQLKPFGLALGGVLLLISAFAEFAKAMASQKPIGGILVDHLITGAIIAAVIGSYETFTSAAVYFATYLNVIVGGTSPFAAILQLVTSFFTAIVGVIAAVFNSFGCVSFMDGVSGLVGMFVDAILSILLILVALVFILKAIGEVVFVLLLGPVALGVGVIVGPLSISCLASKFTRPFFDKWLGFIAAAALTQFVAYAILKLISAFIIAGTPSVAASGTWFAAQALSIALIAFSAGKIMEMAPGMANALVPGTTGMSGGGGGLVAAGMGIVGGSIAGAAIGGAVAAAKVATGTSSAGGALSSASGAASSGASIGASIAKAFGATDKDLAKISGSGGRKDTSNISENIAAGASKAFEATYSSKLSGGSDSALQKGATEAAATRAGKQSENITANDLGGRASSGDTAKGAADSRQAAQSKVVTGLDSRPNKGLTS